MASVWYVVFLLELLDCRSLALTPPLTRADTHKRALASSWSLVTQASTLSVLGHSRTGGDGCGYSGVRRSS